jgi:trehalose/maltose hydrolase-like predicted phosphorylase
MLLRDTARYWASRITTDPDGSAHIRGVIGPDEYHERVDDNAFTNAMARWNLRTAARRAPVKEAERAAWSVLADALTDGYDAITGLYEQFQGYFDLQPLLVREIAEPPMAADVLAGRDAIAGSQVVKQPDALMIHHLLPEDAVPGSLRHNVDFYAPRTAHGSSLSPAVMALLHARAGQPDTALDLLRLSLRIDLDDLGGTTSAGVHIGACGGAWQAVVRGFLGARVSRGWLHLDPVLPSQWPDLEVRFRCLATDVRVRVSDDAMVVDASAPLTVAVSPDRRPRTSTSTEVRFVTGGMP